MICYHCGCHLSEHDFCTACGADVSLYKKIMSLSNRFYNDGLEKAGVRDLTGAVSSLRQSLKLNKNSIDARNLLGLVYFEMGEVVAALSEWVISKNLRADKNVADDYINRLQSNAARLDSINQTIKKYNQAYSYCLQDAKDLAVIQLKKVLSLNPRFIRAHLLLALLYVDSEEWEAADRELCKCMDIDRNNTLALRYRKEVREVLAADEAARQSSSKRKKKKDETVRYQSDNEIIIQPLTVKEAGNGISNLVNIGIGIVIGLAAMYFLVVPAMIANVNNESQKNIQVIGEQSDVKTATIQELEGKLAKLQEDNDALHKELDGYVGADGTLRTIDNLLAAATIYLESKDVKATAQMLEGIAQNVKLEGTSEKFQQLYRALIALIGPELSVEYYTQGFGAYREEDYQTAIELLSKAVYYDENHMDALYNLGNAYRMSGDTEKAIATYSKVEELFPGTDRANRAKKYKEGLVPEN